MSEKKSERKVVSRTLAFAIGIMAIVLLVSLAVAITSYTSTISADNTKIQALTSQKNQIQFWLDGNETEIEIDDNIVNLTDSMVWANWTEATQPVYRSITSGTQSPEYHDAPAYAGYVNATLISPAASDISFRVYYASHGVDYDQTINVSSGEVASFPILPGNVEWTVERAYNVSSIETVTIIYYY